MPKFKITAPRYVDGEYIHASPDFPAVIELAEVPAKDRVSEWKNLFLLEDEISKPKPHYADKGGSHPQTSAEMFGKKKGGRAADSEPV